VDNAQDEVAAANYPLIRQFKVARQVSATPMETAQGDWQTCSPESVQAFTAVGYFFARDLYVRLNVPIGIVNCTCSGTPLESWMSPMALGAFPGQADGRAAAEATAAVKAATPASLFNGMIHPLLPYAIRGALWYQGESDVGRASEYTKHFPALIAAWRAHFGEGDFPFFWVQLAGFAWPGKESGQLWALLREAQSKALSLPATGQAVAIDIGEVGNVQPRNKQEVGRRLALLAKAKVYSIPVDYSGPAFSRITIEGPSVRVHFSFAGEGLTASGKPLQSFEAAGADHVFHPASAEIEGDTVLVESAEVRLPVAVRYAWRDAPEANLYNGAGLPAAPFRSDAWCWRVTSRKLVYFSPRLAARIAGAGDLECVRPGRKAGDQRSVGASRGEGECSRTCVGSGDIGGGRVVLVGSRNRLRTPGGVFSDENAVAVIDTQDRILERARHAKGCEARPDAPDEYRLRRGS
jgi:sialate O-acetylesterase